MNTENRAEETDYEKRYGQVEEEEEDEEEEDEEEPKPEPSHVGKIVAIVALAALLAGSLAVNYYLFDDNNALSATQTDQAKEKQRMDTLLAAKTEVEKQLGETQALVASYQSDNENVNRLLEAANVDITKKQNTIDRLWREKAGVKAFEAQLVEARTLNESLRAQIAALTQELGFLKTDNVGLKDSLVA
ncbi:MAG: hypothetical protein H7Z75_12325, partial [Ferruginibacter sp.]|nr:hypothetical protein [Cytophagales bacterium]